MGKNPKTKIAATVNTNFSLMLILKSTQAMIPKIIHYCWFGGNPLPELAQKCIESWRKYCPDYEIKRWDETNFDLNYNDYVREAYEAKKWAFVTDVVRLYALVNYGGIYMDTDVEVLRSLDDFLKYEAFSGFESETDISTGIMASEKGQKLFEELLCEYINAHFLQSDGTYDEMTNVSRITNTCLKYGFIPNNKLQTIKGFTLFPKDYFCPKNYVTRVTRLTGNTYTIHHFDGSWVSEEERYVSTLKQRYLWIPLRVVKGISTIKLHGFRAFIKKAIEWCKKK